MATNSTTTALIVGAGALTDYLVRGSWTLRSFIISVCGAVSGYFLALFILTYFHEFRTAPSEAQIAVSYFCGFFAQKIIHRINRMTVKASVGGVEVNSEGD